MRYSNLAAIVAASVLFDLPATAQNTAAPADPELVDAAPASSDADIFLDDLPDVVHGSATWGE